MNKNKEIADYEAKFEPENLEIAFVTDSSGFGAVRTDKEGTWTVRLGISAWQIIGKDEVIVEQVSITQKVENTDKIKREFKRDSIMSAKVRRGEKSFLLIGFTNSASKKPFVKLEKILSEQLKPIHYADKIFGEFTLDKSINCFGIRMKWCGEDVRISFKNDTDIQMKKAIDVAHKLFENQIEWNERIKKYAAEQLVELAEDWADSENYDDDEEEEAITAKEFTERIALEDIEVSPSGDFSFWFDDDNIFFGHSICISGGIETGPNDAGIHG